MRLRYIIFSILVFVWMFLIFSLSHRPSSESQEDSCSVGLLFGRMVISDFEEWTEKDQLAFAMKVDHPIRKLAHFTEYFILAVLLFGAVDSKKKKTILRWLIPWIIATIYAVTDEVHQFFIPGRNCNALDVFIDSAGACVGVIICILVTRLANNRCQNRITN